MKTLTIRIQEEIQPDLVDRLLGWFWWWTVSDGTLTVASGFARTETRAQARAEKVAARAAHVTRYTYTTGDEG